MAKRYKPKVQEIKSSPKVETERGRTHRVHLIERATYFDAKCQTCGKGAICGGLDADKLLRKWAEWHAAKVEVLQSGE